MKIPDHGLTEHVLDQVVDVLARRSQVERATLFGSRAKGVHKHGSDIDLALVGPALDWRIVAKIEHDLDDLLLPYEFSIVILNASTDPALAQHIARVGVPLYERR